TFITNRLSHLLYFDRYGQCIHQTEYRKESDSLVKPDSGLIARLKIHPLIAQLNDSSQTVTSILVFSHTIMIVSLRPVLTSNAEGPPQGVQVMIREVDDQFQDELRQLTQLEFELVPVSADDSLVLLLSDDPDLSTSEVLIRPDTAHHLVVYSLIRDIDNHPSVLINLKIKQVYYIQTLRNLRLFIYLVIVFFVLMGTLILFFSERILLAPLQQLIDFVKKIHFMENLSSRLRISRHNELSGLADTINTMLSQLELDRMKKQSMEMEIRESRIRYQALVSGLPDIVLVHLNGRVLFVNQSVEAITGYEPEEVYQISLYDVLADEERPLFLTSPSDKKEEVRFYIKSGAIKVFETRSQAIVFDHQSAVLVVLTDITEQRSIEKELEKNEARLRYLFNESTDAIFYCDSTDKIIQINTAGSEMLGCNPVEQAMGLDLKNMVTDKLLFADIKQRIFINRGIRNVELNLMPLEAKTEKTVLLSAMLFNPEDEQAGGYWGLIRDITEMRKLEQQLFQSQKMEGIGRLAGGIAHDFNNILGGIVGYISLLREKMPPDSNLQRYMDVIEKGSYRAIDLISKLMVFARDRKQVLVSVDLNSVCEETVKIASSTFEKQITINEEYGQDLPMIDADPSQIQQVVLNLLINARDAMPNGGTLTIKTGREAFNHLDIQHYPEAKAGLYSVLSIADTGHGMDRQTQQRIFEPFFTTKSEGKGTGLGLAVTYGVIKNHGGFIKLYSEIGLGTEFRIYIPAGSGVEHTISSSFDDKILSGNETILVVDDETTILNLLKEVLESYGYKVLQASNGEEALDVYRENSASIRMVILDVIMPKMGGQETLQYLKSMNPEVKVIVSTGYSEESKLDRIIKDGVCGIVFKPYKYTQLLQKIRQFLDE
ncbi:MAG: response regulator, partial [Candidatus Delongbacteria bacterium]|nr:response regulator [Candidatus Delongbacteria bacterium]